MRNTNHIVSRGLLGLVALAALGVAAPAHAEQTAATLVSIDPSRTFNNGLGYSSGWVFSLNQSVNVTSLGYFDHLGDGLSEPHDVGIFDVATQSLLVSGTVTTSDTLNNNFRYTSVGPTVLVTGKTYVIVGTSGVVDPVTFLGVYSMAPEVNLLYGNNEVNGFNLAFPIRSGPPYFGPNFKFSAVPEPSEWAAMGVLGLALGGLVVRKRRTR